MINANETGVIKSLSSMEYNSIKRLEYVGQFYNETSANSKFVIQLQCPLSEYDMFLLIGYTPSYTNGSGYGPNIHIYTREVYSSCNTSTTKTINQATYNDGDDENFPVYAAGSMLVNGINYTYNIFFPRDTTLQKFYLALGWRSIGLSENLRIIGVQLNNAA